ncbi:MAG: glycosyltransferase family 4 protein, partial [Thermodesulfovibrionia bacterium]|nr:glycosyltransferase family 4 protein [Thermodesulfovibrionia bacterium]
SILQAMAMEKPVVASDLAPLKEVVIENETGILVSKKEPEGIARAVIRLLRDKELSKQLGENGRRLAIKSYSFDGMLDKLETLYKENRTSINNEYLAQRNA